MNQNVLIPIIYIILYINYMSIIKKSWDTTLYPLEWLQSKRQTLTSVTKRNVLECSEEQFQNSPKLFIFTKSKYPSLAEQENKRTLYSNNDLQLQPTIRQSHNYIKRKRDTKRLHTKKKKRLHTMWLHLY